MASSEFASCRLAMTLPVAGSFTSKVFPEEASRHSPSISRPVGTESSRAFSRSSVTVMGHLFRIGGARGGSDVALHEQGTGRSGAVFRRGWTPDLIRILARGGPAVPRGSAA